MELITTVTNSAVIHGTLQPMQHIRIYYLADSCVNSGVVASNPGVVPAQEGCKGVQRASITEAQR